MKRFINQIWGAEIKETKTKNIKINFSWSIFSLRNQRIKNIPNKLIALKGRSFKIKVFILFMPRLSFNVLNSNVILGSACQKPK